MSEFSALYPTVRTFLGDIGAVPVYSNDQLDLGIRASLLFDEDFGLGEPDMSGGLTVSPDVSAKEDEARIALRAAIHMLSPNSGAFSWGSRSMRVSRGNAWEAHLGYLQGLLRKSESGAFAIASTSEWDQWLRGTSETIANLSSFPG